MGDVADMLIDLAIDYYGYDREQGAYCRRCGRFFLWGNIGTERAPVWRLITPGGKEHSCGRTASIDEFDTVKPTHDEFGNPL